MAKPDDKERAALAAALEKLDEEQLGRLHGALTELRDELMDANSAFPETKRFLESRGLTHVSQLDAQGRQDLTAHLRAVLAKLTN